VLSAATRCGVFVNNRHDDAGWAANVVAEALRRRLGRSSDVFIDNQSIGPGQPFAQVLEEGVQRSAVLVALIGQRWAEPPSIDRLFMADDWVRREILLAKSQESIIVPVLVDRENLPSVAALPKELQFLAGLQAFRIRQANPEDVDVLADKMATLVPSGCHETTGRAGMGVENSRTAVEKFL
jgi:TIR domain